MDAAPQTFSKSERICGEKSVSTLLAKGRYGVEGVLRYCFVRNSVGHPRLMVSVPKKMFKRAVKRNLLKRRLREAFRHQKGSLEGAGVDILLIYSCKEIVPCESIYALVETILGKVRRSMAASAPSQKPDSSQKSESVAAQENSESEK